MKLDEIKQKTKGDLQNLLNDNRKKMQDLRFELASSRLKNVREIRKLRKEVAQILTILKGK